MCADFPDFMVHSMVAMTVDWDRLAQEANHRPAKFVCRMCCSDARMDRCDNGCCIITVCAKHPSIMIRDGKVIGTSA